MAKTTKSSSNDGAVRPSKSKPSSKVAKAVTDLGNEVGGEGPCIMIAPVTASPAASSKQATVLEMLRRPEGVSVESLMDATGWQKHSVRGFLSGTVKKRLGLVVTCEGVAKERKYRIGVAAPAPTPEVSHAGQ